MSASLDATEARSREVAKTGNRVSLEVMAAAIVEEEYLSPTTQPHMTIAVLKLRNGFTLVGKSAPADPANFDEAAGREFARDDAMRQAWPLFGFAQREKLADTPALP